MQAASWRGLNVDEYRTHILVGHQSRLGGVHHPAKGSNSYSHEGERERSATDEPSDGMLVTARQRGEYLVEPCVEAGGGLVVHDDSTKGRGECQGIE